MGYSPRGSIRVRHGLVAQQEEAGECFTIGRSFKGKHVMDFGKRMQTHSE